MRVNVTHTIGDLFRDLREIDRKAKVDMRATVLDGIRAGNSRAKSYAKQKNDADSHSRKYPGTFSAEMHRTNSFGGVNLYSGEYGPRHSGQGMLAPILEDGVPGRNAPQNNMRRSVDVVIAEFPRAARKLPDGWFW